MTKKVYATKSESPASVIGKVLNCSDEDVILYIPRGSTFSKTRNNFILLKRETRAAGKNVSVESVDDDILELAATSGLKAVNPFLGKKQVAVSDIVSVREGGSEIIEPDFEYDKEDYKEVKEKKKRFRRKSKKSKENAEDISASLDVDDSGGDDDETVLSYAGDVDTSPASTRKIKRPKKNKVKSDKSPLKRPVVIFSGLSALGIAIFVGVVVLPRVTINLELEKTDWDFVGSLKVGSSITENSFNGDVVSLRGVTFSEKKNITKTYLASESDFVERKATGVITIYNDFSSKSQDLVKTTRFETPDGKIYKIDKNVTVPGASTVDGKLVPSSIDVSVTADAIGEEYNIGPVSRFSIPGFEGSPKFDGFYGRSTAPMTGGFVGERKVASDEDINAARLDVIGAIEEAAKSQLFLNLPNDTRVLEGTYEFNITDEKVDDGDRDSDAFSITIFGEASVIVFRGDELVDLFEDRVERDVKVDLVSKEYTIDYGEPRISEEGVYSSAINVSSTWTRPFTPETFINDIVGKNEAELKALIFDIDGVQSGEVRFWPFWVNKVPEKEDRIVVDVN